MATSSSPAPAPAGEALRQKRILSSKLYLDVPSSKVDRGYPSSHFQLPGIRRAAFPCFNRIVFLNFLAGTGDLLAGLRHLLPRAREAVSRPHTTYVETRIGIQMCLTMAPRA